MELIQQELRFYTPRSGKLSGFTETTDAIVPDSYPDIETTAFSCATINVKDEVIQPDRVLISGQIDAVILYRTLDSDQLFRLNVPLNFAHVEDAPGISENSLHFLKYTMAEIDVRIVNSRKICVSCVCAVHMELFDRTFAQLTTGVQNSDDLLELHTTHRQLPLINAAESKRFVILDDIELHQDACRTPLHTTVQYGDIDCTVTNGKLILNGNATLRIWDMDQTGVISLQTHRIPFHQILDTDLLNNDTPTHVLLSCHSTICHYSNEDILSVNLNTEALFWQEEAQELFWIDDLYHRFNEANHNFQPLTLCACEISAPFHCEGTETLSAAHPISDILSATATCTSLLPGETQLLKPILCFSILYREPSGEIHQLQKSCTCNLHSDRALPSVLPTELAFFCTASAQENQINLHIAADGHAIQKDPVTVQNLTELSIVSRSAPEDHPLQILFIREPKSLWEIAKQYHSTVPLLHAYNQLPENTTQIQDMTLLVP